MSTMTATPRALPRSDWPASDQRMWTALFADGGPLDDRGPLVHLRATTQVTLARRYARWLGWLAREMPWAFGEPPEARMTLERLWTWLEADLGHTSPQTRLLLLQGALRVLKAHAPERDWSGPRRLLRIERAAAWRHQGQRKIGRVPLSSALLEAGLDFATRQAETATTTLGALRARRDGAMVALLALMPMRSRAFRELALGRSFAITRTGYHIRLSEEMTKTGHPWEARVPDVLAPVLRRYIEEVRPQLLARGPHTHDIFWVTEHGTPFDECTLRRRVCQVTRRQIDVDVPPHFFRDAAATTLALTSPSYARLIRSLLGHACFRTAERHYIQAKGIEAGRDHATVIEKLRRALPHRS